MSVVLNILNHLKKNVVEGSQVPSDQVFLKSPVPAMIGKGLVVCISKVGGKRSPKEGNSRWAFSTLQTMVFSVVIMVDDMERDVLDDTTVNTLYDTVEDISKVLYEDPIVKATAVAQLLPRNTELTEYLPGEEILPTAMKTDTGGSLMIGERLTLSIEFVENWKAKLIDRELVAVQGKIKTETTERSFYGKTENS